MNDPTDYLWVLFAAGLALAVVFAILRLIAQWKLAGIKAQRRHRISERLEKLGQ